MGKRGQLPFSKCVTGEGGYHLVQKGIFSGLPLVRTPSSRKEGEIIITKKFSIHLFYFEIVRNMLEKTPGPDFCKNVIFCIHLDS